MVDAFIEYGDRARVATWQIDVRRPSRQRRGASPTRSGCRRVESLYRLSLNPHATVRRAHDFTITSEDLELTLAEGSVFTVDTDQGVTGLVLIGRGEMRFRPTPDTEKGQVRIFAGAETLESRFDAAYRPRRRSGGPCRSGDADRRAGRSARSAAGRADLPRGVGQVASRSISAT